MSEETHIGWTDHTGGPWFGCSKVSEGCKNCYAWILMLFRYLPLMRRAYRKAGFADWETRPGWGEKATRVVTKGFWTDARKLNQKHREAGTRGKWFPSMIDWLDPMPAGILSQDGIRLDPLQVLGDFMQVVFECQSLDWLLLTKRPKNWYPRLAAVFESLKNPHYGNPGFDFYCWLNEWLYVHNIKACGGGPQNVWVGVSVENNAQLPRLAALRKIPARVRFVSFEPLLEDLRLRRKDLRGIHWAIPGGESGKDRRDCGVDALCRSAITCKQAGLRVFVKQDCAFQPGQQGRIPEAIWRWKEFPDIWSRMLRG